ncbi:MAG TPA: hypothetical protein VGN23_01560 [Verrucomicrobiae bacterium]|jgi:hypothetical protein
MKTVIKSAGLLCFTALFFFPACAKEKYSSWDSYPDVAIAAQLKRFVAEKTAQAEASVAIDGHPMSPELNQLFEAAARGDWPAVDKDFTILKKLSSQSGIAWQSAINIWGAFNAVTSGNPKYSMLFTSEIINSIPPGSIYFGGTGVPSFLVAVMEKSQTKGAPFFLIVQDDLARGGYLDYLHSLYGNQIYIPKSEDLQKCSEDYIEDVQKRAQDHRLNPGENVVMDPKTGRVSTNSYYAMIGIDAIVTKIIFDQNSNRDFYIEQGFPFDWMYPYLEPHGMILKLNRQPLSSLSDGVIKQDHDYWAKLLQPMIGNWLHDDTSAQDVADFAEKVFLRHDFTSFTGDPQFIQNEYSQSPYYQMFSKERLSIAGLYMWRADQTSDLAEKKRMDAAADYACRQAWAICPDSDLATVEYVQLLMQEKRKSDALLIAETANKFRSTAGSGQPGTSQIDALITAIK